MIKYFVSDFYVYFVSLYVPKIQKGESSGSHSIGEFFSTYGNVCDTVFTEICTNYCAIYRKNSILVCFNLSNQPFELDFETNV